MANTIYDQGNGEDYYIKIKNLKKVYSNGIAAVVDNSMCVKKGEIVGLLGPNGAGKSTMFNISSMSLKRTSGGVKIMDHDIDHFNFSMFGN